MKKERKIILSGVYGAYGVVFYFPRYWEEEEKHKLKIKERNSTINELLNII